MTEPFAAAARIADAVLYEGYLLYPYRRSALKNQLRWQFGVLVPPAYSDHDPSERSSITTECLLDAPREAVLRVRLRGLAVEGDQGEPCEADVPETSLAALAPRSMHRELQLHGVAVTVGISTEAVDEFVRVRVTVSNATAWPEDEPFTRDRALECSLVSAHVLMSVHGGRFVSLLDPPPSAAAAVATCRHDGVWPVLVGPPGTGDVVLAAPIILYDHPEIAPESAGDLFDATEIEELLLLRVMTLTDEEKAAARASDPRALAIVDRSDHVPAEVLARLHGARRQLRRLPAASTTSVAVAGVDLAAGSTVRLRPRRRADAMDLFLGGRSATVQGVFEQDGGRVQLAVTVDDDPAADLHQWYGRYLWFDADEVEPVR